MAMSVPTSMSIGRKVVLVTGASSGIGAATAKLLAERGHHVVPGGRHAERLKEITEDIHAAGGSAEYHALDVTGAKQVRAFIDSAYSRHGRVDVSEIIVRPTASQT
ncbi:SDR family NAD(P)-dependent oxidoreductase [Streptomyces sp. RLB1-33]|uniref:SDR family NAD(P)-dependent oxidoreductase n=1 Tax=Streptomyces mirabilis TaxID=68239 RepID=UPI00143E9EC9|nr:MULTISPECIES: SDR family NAD(P)-dependent oxidoreductase [Streptomyces]QIY74651.1 SDR family NAD(P)-dependent oxidoreductase [Streptomyces sp. RLB1-33]QUW78148.1 SDR family NAD(P)-dependent oxidoreductase [Streptomyces mirabilis]